MAIQVSTEILEGSVLALLNQQDYYGYTITKKMQRSFPISESTMYPILRRLKKSGWLSTYDQSYEGRNRRYYQITSEGKTRLNEIKADWEKIKLATNRILEETDDR